MCLFQKKFGKNLKKFMMDIHSLEELALIIWNYIQKFSKFYPSKKVNLITNRKIQERFQVTIQSKMFSQQFLKTKVLVIKSFIIRQLG